MYTVFPANFYGTHATKQMFFEDGDFLFAEQIFLSFDIAFPPFLVVHKENVQLYQGFETILN